jgi:hypothetical protein
MHRSLLHEDRPLPRRRGKPEIMSQFLILLCSIWTTCLAAATQTWTWETYSDGRDVWLRSACDGAVIFDYRLGAGGAIAEMRDVADGKKRLLSPSFQGETTDRIIQWTWWSSSITHAVAELPKFEHRFNVTQGGDFAGQLAPIIAVIMQPSSRHVDVYSVPEDQWKSQQQAAMQTKISALTRYEMATDGVLIIRRIMLVGRVMLHGKITPLTKLYVEGWTPFDRSGTFDGLALGLDQKGTPNWWYRAGENIPNYPGLSAAKTNGYAVVFPTQNSQTNPAVGLVFGKGEVTPAGKGNAYLLNTMSWDNGIGVLPALQLADVAEDSVIEVTLALLPRRQLDADMAAKLHALVPQIPAPILHPPGTAFTGEMADIIARLHANRSAAGKRTEHLASQRVTSP